MQTLVQYYASLEHNAVTLTELMDKLQLITSNVLSINVVCSSQLRTYRVVMYTVSQKKNDNDM